MEPVGTNIQTKRVYDDAQPGDGARYLVDRLWPRGVKKEALQIEAWLKEAAPSTGLRRWYGHDPQKWGEFKQRYFAELDTNPQAWQPLARAAKHGQVTLLYSSREETINNATALKEYLEQHQEV
jgi:uncharacterized protein YeaO (DUF488 family)